MKVVLDTNILIAAGFASHSASARIVEAARKEQLELVWDEPTRAETRKLFKRIPRLDWKRISGIYREENEYTGETRPGDFGIVEDRTDRKFAALAGAAGAVLVSNDDHLLGVRDQLEVEIVTPGEFVRQHFSRCAEK